MSKKVMKLVDPYTGKMQCEVCGSVHFASIKPQSNGQYYRGSWQCINGCLPLSFYDNELPDYLKQRYSARTFGEALGKLKTFELRKDFNKMIRESVAKEKFMIHQ